MITKVIAFHILILVFAMKTLNFFIAKSVWTEDECIFLAYAVKYFDSNWKDIAKYYKLVFNNRRPKDLNHKYKFLKLTKQLETYEKQIERHLDATLQMIIKRE